MFDAMSLTHFYFGTPKKQLELGFRPLKEVDRNYDQGGRSFYFFDFDDNILNLLTPIVIFHKHNGEEKSISSRELAAEGANIGQSGPFKDYQLSDCVKTGSFRNFRDIDIDIQDRIQRRKNQNFTKDIYDILQLPEHVWKGPSWNYFHYAAFNQRPLAIITARGHDPETIKEGIEILLEEKHIQARPNYLGVFPVTNEKARKELGDCGITESVAGLKKLAIKKSVQVAFKRYGENPFHRFGMSDDDPKNVELITEAMVELKQTYPDNAFFVINTHEGKCIKKEIFKDHFKETEIQDADNLQPSLFDL
ncbi:MAG: hypothetical protein HYV97_04065 [Bdellovibrio sp.]|nr:hypothetical protein [Bdellovibrio sp.]